MKKILIVVVVFIVLALGIQIGKQSTKPHTTATPPVVPSQSGQQSTQKEIILKDIAYATHERNTLNVLVPK